VFFNFSHVFIQFSTELNLNVPKKSPYLVGFWRSITFCRAAFFTYWSSNFMLSYNPTPVIKIVNDVTEGAQCTLFVKREDLNHPWVSGNKWWKLRDNLAEAARLKKTLLTFGGAYSNHIFATAAATHLLNMKSIGVIRGERPEVLSTTLAFAEQHGMQLHFVTRAQYKNKTSPLFVDQLHLQLGDFHSVPEGGSNPPAVNACREWGQLICRETPTDFVCVAVGTGGTLAGLSQGMTNTARLLGVSVLKSGSFLEDEIRKLSPTANWQLTCDYHFGGYAKTNNTLNNFIADFETQHHIPLDFVYTGKLLYAILDLMKKGFFDRGSSILAIHTGGLQGRNSSAHYTAQPSK
jgi:1-aminocyclopropane-1-carboxylate deaminase